MSNLIRIKKSDEIAYVGMDIADVLMRALGFKSKSDARRQIKQKGVSLQDELINDPFARLAFDSKTNMWFLIED